MVKANGTNVNVNLQGTEQHKDIVDGQGNLIAILYRNQDQGYSMVTVFETQSGNPRRGLVTVRYMGSSAQIVVDSRLRGSLAGVCGQIESDALVSLAGPRKCVYSKPQLLVASYRVSTQGHQCQPIAEQQVQQQLQQEQQQCIKAKIVTSEVLRQT